MKNKLLHLLEDKKTIIGLLTLAFCESCYAFTNYLTTGMQPHLLPLFQIDHAIPFFPFSVWVYLSEVIICIVAFYCAKNLKNIARYLGSLVTVTLAAVCIFIFFPTTFPRVHFPMPVNIDYVTLGLFNWLRKVDYPTNCLPSLHVCYSYLASFVFLQEQRSKFLFFFTWASLIALSTMTTKQHYFLDVIVGLVLAYGVYRLFLSWMPPTNENPDLETTLNCSRRQ